MLNSYFKLIELNNELFTEGFYFIEQDGRELYADRLGELNVKSDKLKELLSILDTLEKNLIMFKGMFKSSDSNDFINILDNNIFYDIELLIDYPSNIYELCDFDEDKFTENYMEEKSLDAYDDLVEIYNCEGLEKAHEKFEELALLTKEDIDTLRLKLNYLIENIPLLVRCASNLLEYIYKGE